MVRKGAFNELLKLDGRQCQEDSCRFLCIRRRKGRESVYWSICDAGTLIPGVLLDRGVAISMDFLLVLAKGGIRMR